MRLGKNVSAEKILALAHEHYAEDRLREAEQICRQALRTHADSAELWHLLGAIFDRLGMSEFAISFLLKATSLAPDVAEFHRTLGRALRKLGRIDAAAHSFRRYTELRLEDPKGQTDLGRLLTVQGKYVEALSTLQRALDLDPDNGAVHNDIGVVHSMAGRLEDAVASFTRAVELESSKSGLQSNLLFTRHYVESSDPSVTSAAARSWSNHFAESLTRSAATHENVPNPNRRLRIGYLSGDFRFHPVGRTLLAMLPHHDDDEVEVFCYSNNDHFDSVTERLFRTASHVRNINPLDDETAANLIRSDGIDVLIDLSGHTTHNRLLVVARKPAPVQVVWLGYFHTTGMTAVDYIIADPRVCPEESGLYVETIARLPHSFLCFHPRKTHQMSAGCRSQEHGCITFGSFNNPLKLSDGVIDAWSQVLDRVPGSRLLLKYFSFDDAGAREYFAQRFADRRVDVRRINFLGRSPFYDHLAAYNQVDIALDPFPYNGGATSFDALWMGVPVIALRGTQFVGRMGASILTTLNMPELIATTPGEYVERVIQLSHDVEWLKACRAGLRDRLLAIALMRWASVGPWARGAVPNILAVMVWDAAGGPGSASCFAGISRRWR